jgi:glycerol-3-phosphate dehydrogenase (NAD(P)+)
MLTIVGAGAMGAALAVHATRSGAAVTVLGTRFDEATIGACRRGEPHPALGMTMPSSITWSDESAWDDVLAGSEEIVLAVSSAGLADVVESAARRSPAGATWLVATKGWDETTLRSPSEIIAGALGSLDHLAVMAGPALAAELAAGAVTSVVCAARRPEVARQVLRWLQAGPVSVTVTDDVVGAETAAAYKNVIAVAVGICEGLAERMIESVYVHRFANARAATFALGLRDMARLTEARGGRADTILGLAGAGDLYVTCLGGRNGRFGQRLGAGETPEQAVRSIGSTVEGVANTAAALAVAERLSVELPTARAVHAVLSGAATPEGAIQQLFEGLRAADLEPPSVLQA